MAKTSTLRPRRILDLRFPDLPNTLHGAMKHKRVEPRLLASLPANYDRDGSFPVLVYLAGGDGSAVTRKDLAYVRRLAGDQDVIAVAMPLFKKCVDPEEPHAGVYIGAYDDYPVISRCYHTMLKALFAAVPNVDPERSVLGGFSNGAHTTALLLSCVDPFVLKHFAGFFLLDGGWHIASHHKRSVQHKRLIYFLGGSRRSKRRRSLLDSMSWSLDGAPHITLVKMPGVEHAFPDQYIPQLREWFMNPGHLGS